MNHLRRFLPFALLLAVGCTTQRPPVPIVLGDIAPRSGPLREQGIAAEAAIRLAVTEANAADDKVAGRPVEVRHPDSEGKPEVAQSVAVRLLAVANVSALLAGSDAAVAERLYRLAPQYRVPVLTPVWLPPADLGNYGFCVGVTPAARGKALARCAVEHVGACQLLILTDTRSPEARAVAAAIVEQVGNKSLVHQRDYASDEQFAEVVKNVEPARFPAIVLAGRVAELERLHDDLAATRTEPVPALLYAGSEDARLPRLAAQWAPAQAIYWTMLFAPDSLTPRAVEFARRFEESTQRAADPTAMLAYDATRLVLEAIRQAKTTRGDKIREELLKLKDFESLSGPVSFDKSQCLDRQINVVRWQGKVTTVALPES